jgi:hypothetical protein
VGGREMRAIAKGKRDKSRDTRGLGREAGDRGREVEEVVEKNTQGRGGPRSRHSAIAES